MKRVAVTTTLALCLLLTWAIGASYTAQAGTYVENFDDGDFDGWEIFDAGEPGSEWTVENGVLTCRREIIWMSDLLFGEEDWRNYTIECDARIVEPLDEIYGMAFDLRVTYPEDDETKMTDVTCLASGSSKTAFIWPGLNGEFLDQTPSSDFDFELGRWYRLKGVAHEDTFEFYVDGRLVASYTDDRMPTGRLGLMAAGASVLQFDNVIITGDDVPDNTDSLVAGDLLPAMHWFEEAWRVKNADLLLSVYTDDAMFEAFPYPPMNKEEDKPFLEYMFSIYPTFDITRDSFTLVSVADEVGVLEHTDTYVYPDNGAPVEELHICLMDFRGPKAKRLTVYGDWAAGMIQAGAMPPRNLGDMIPSFPLPAPEGTGLAPMKASAEFTARLNSGALSNVAKMIRADADTWFPFIGRSANRSEFIDIYEQLLGGFSDANWENTRRVDMDDGWVFSEVTLRGNNDGEFLGKVATGLPMEIRAGLIEHYDESGLATYVHFHFDTLSVPGQEAPTEPAEDFTVADVIVAPGAAIPGDVEGTVLLLAGEHKTDETVEITQSLTLTAEPGAVWISNADPAIAVHANDVTISNLVLKSADPTATAIVSGSPVTLKQPSHRVTVVSNQIEGFVSGILHVYGDGFIARNNQITGVEVPLNAFESDTVGILNAMGSDAIIEGNQISGFFDGIFLSGAHGRAQGNHIRRVNVGIFMCNWNLPVAGEPDFFSDLIPNNAANYWDVNGNEITDGIQMAGYLFEYPVWGINVGSGGTGTNHNLIHGNRISGFTDDIVLLGQLTPFEPLFGLSDHKSYENVVIANPGQVLENLPDDPGPSFGNVLIGIKPVDEAGMALLEDVLKNAGPLTETTVEDFSRVFFTSLSAGLNMISLPLKPVTPYDARSFAEELSATVVIKFDEAHQRFVGFTLDAPDNGFAIEGGKGYIVNVPEGQTVAFTGATWTNQPLVEAAPDVRGLNPRTTDSAWAFVVSGAFSSPDDKSNFDGYTIQARNLRTGVVQTSEVWQTSEVLGYFALTSADLSKNSIIQAGDKLEIIAIDSSGDVVSRVVRTIDSDNIGKAYLNVHLRLGDIIPSQTALLQNYPNPFNPETWIPFTLAEDSLVTINIYDTKGQLVRRFDLGKQGAGVYTSRDRALYWDGRNDTGERVSSGIYFYQLRAGKFTAVQKLVIMK